MIFYNTCFVTTSYPQRSSLALFHNNHQIWECYPQVILVPTDMFKTLSRLERILKVMVDLWLQLAMKMTALYSPRMSLIWDSNIFDLSDESMKAKKDRRRKKKRVHTQCLKKCS